jgi:hypothetical protein
MKPLELTDYALSLEALSHRWGVKPDQRSVGVTVRLAPFQESRSAAAATLVSSPDFGAE